MTAVTLDTLRNHKKRGEKFAALTAYDASFAGILEAADVELLLVGDSLGMVVQGRESTVPVTMEEMIYHTRAVRRGTRRALLMADLPFMSYATPELAMRNAARLMQEGGAHCIKLEAAAPLVDTVEALAMRGIPVCAHLGLSPQMVHKLGGYRVQGRGAAAAEAMLLDARAMETAGADLLLLECVPRTLAAEITAAVEIPVIGIGAGSATDGQVLVLYDLLGITPGRPPRFAHNFLAGAGTIEAAVADYVKAVREGHFPTAEQSFD